ncbi:DUF1330 domain-containing protein [Ramlibacter sp. WS9]|uniref:DUF1330 domain-containing protein n=1 Tax=Ramlibacter sp. WS9 TaxID=1882741 RepID=UPI0011416E29|nr:DUF1330 domain-containing protein [Ramlibacter sp. WS9]ROZ75036.1 DUF1330 domain-containing protein [Ramlibacter sp. WS9]
MKTLAAIFALARGLASPSFAAAKDWGGFEVEALKNHPDGKPVVMLNLIKFRAKSLDGNGTGLDAYTRYTAVAIPMTLQRGGKTIWLGKVDHSVLNQGSDVNWDVAFVVEYPSRAAFIDMVTHKDYRKANLDRENGVEKQIVLANTTAGISMVQSQPATPGTGATTAP